MTKLEVVTMIVLPQVHTVASLLRAKDANSTGADDIAADIMDFAASAVQAATLGQELPKLPDSLAKKLGYVPVVEAKESDLITSAK